ncbi:hypothetical protein ACJ73_07395 [Blastomyces percursus]|uniref:Chromo domain-containing protein n=1 Tax=Blastomyces percursus TaxID=1658174 RepID=A0A1J9PZF1_9EURO|nr:hypothetical protein ACJ73_07395 [Blastomyces percursus]
MAEQFDCAHTEPTLRTGDFAFLNLARKGEKGYVMPNAFKLSPLRIGPFEIVEKVSDVTFRLRLPPSWQKTLLRPLDLEHPPPEPVTVDNQLQFEIEKILSQRTQNGKTYLHIKWKGYDEPTWEPREVIASDTPDLVKAFAAKRPRGRPPLKRS